MREFFFSQRITRFSVPFLLATALAVIAGCSAGGGSSSSTPTPPTGSAVAATIQVSASLSQILSTATSTSDVTVVVLDATGQAISGKVVTFSTSNDPSAYYTNVVATTDANGIASATLNIGSNQTNRTITVAVTADAAKGTTPITVAGTTITITGNATVALNASTTLTVSMKNSAGVAVPGVALTVTSATGNTIVKTGASPVGTTDANGQITAIVTAKSATTPDTITVTGGGATQTLSLTITANSTVFAFSAPITIVPPATTPEILVNTATPVSVLWTVNGIPQTGQTISFYTTRGTFISSTAVTDGTGTATASLSAVSTGSTILTAVGPGGAPIATLNVVFITNTASTVTAQANPSTIGFNSSGSQSNQSVISVVVRDAALNLVKNANVSFTLLADPSGGSLSSGVATTNIAGTATVNYISGGSPSSLNGEQIGVTVDSVSGTVLPSPLTTTASLTVAGQSMFVRLQTDNVVFGAGVSSPTYTKQYSALVTDSGGHPVTAGTPVYFTLRPTLQAFSFFKGYYFYDLLTSQWIQMVTASCANEDTNLNSFLDAGEDTNGNTYLDPVGIASVNASATTDANGYAIASITYSKNYAWWAVMDLEARTSVNGNDPPAVVTVPLIGAAADYIAGIMPPGEISPFGAGASPNNVCTNTL